jgi:hypothetical protein
MVAVAASDTGGSTCGLSIIRTVRTSDNAGGIYAAANGATVYRMPQNTVLTGYRRIAEVDFDGTNYNPASSEFNITTNGILGANTNIYC